MTWTPKTITPPLPPEAQDIVDAISTVTGTVSGILTTFSTLLDAAKIFYNGGTDLFVALMNGIIDAAEDLNNDYFGSGAFQLIIDPFSLPSTRYLEQGINDLAEDITGAKIKKKDQFGIPQLTPAECIAAAIRSFDDTGDENRPIFSDAADITALGLLITAPDLSAFLDLLEKLLSVWTLDDLEFIFDRFQLKVNPVKKSVPVDWGSIRFNQIKALGDIQKENNKALAIARGYLNVGDSIIPELIETIQRKVDVLNDSVTTFQSVVDLILAAAGVPNVFVLDVPLGAGGVNRVKIELRDSDLESLAINKYTVMLLYVAGGPTAVGLDKIRQLVV